MSRTLEGGWHTPSKLNGADERREGKLKTGGSLRENQHLQRLLKALDAWTIQYTLRYHFSSEWPRYQSATKHGVSWTTWCFQGHQEVTVRGPHFNIWKSRFWFSWCIWLTQWDWLSLIIVTENILTRLNIFLLFRENFCLNTGRKNWRGLGMNYFFRYKITKKQTYMLDKVPFRAPTGQLIKIHKLWKN